MFGILLFVLVSLVAYIIWDRYKKYQQGGEMGLTGPPIKFMVGNLHQYMGRMLQDAKAFKLMQQWINQYGKVFGFYIGPQLFVAIADLDMAKEILVKNFGNFTDRQHLSAGGNILKQNLLQLKGQAWKNVRNITSPTFTTGKLKQMNQTIHEKIDVLVSQLVKHAENGNSFDIYDDYQGFTLDVIGKCAFAVNVDCQRDKTDRFFLHCQKFFNNSGLLDSPLLILTSIIFPELEFLISASRPYTTMGKSECWLVSGLEKVLEARIKTKNNFKTSDVLQLLLEANEKNEGTDKPQLSKSEIVSNCYAFLLAGYETTSTALAYTSWLLAAHQNVQRQLQLEADEYSQKHSESDLTAEDVLNLPYLDAVFHESLRVLPPVIGFVTRTCTKECVINGYKFVPGMIAVFPVYTIHYSEEYWPDPTAFKPERFLGERNYDPLAWMPFGNGPRNCIGMRFAEIEYKTALLKIMRKLNFEMAPDSQNPLETVETGVLMRPKDGVTLRVSLREKL